MSAHTPGPWEVSHLGGGVIRSANPSTGVKYARGVGLPQVALAVGLSEHRPTEEWEANANLIAAAPELLAALSRVGCQDEGSCGEPHPVLRPDGLCFVCRAINKARGGR